MDILNSLEGSFLLFVQEYLRVDSLNPFMIIYTQLGNAGILWIGISLFMLLFKRTRKAGCCGILAMLLGLLCTNVVLKNLVGRVRPWVVTEELVPLVEEADPNSFPSGHTCAAFAAAVGWYNGVPAVLALIGLLMAAVMGISRLYVGVHYPTDVFVGAVVGIVCGIVAWKIVSLIDRIIHRSDEDEDDEDEEEEEYERRRKKEKKEKKERKKAAKAQQAGNEKGGRKSGRGPEPEPPRRREPAYPDRRPGPGREPERDVWDESYDWDYEDDYEEPEYEDDYDGYQGHGGDGYDGYQGHDRNEQPAYDDSEPLVQAPLYDDEPLVQAPLFDDISAEGEDDKSGAKGGKRLAKKH